MNRLENERYHSALFNLGDNCSILGKIACNPTTTITPHAHHTQIYTPLTPAHTYILSHLTPSHPIILWQSPLCPCGPPTQRDPAKAN